MQGFPGGPVVKNLPASAGDTGLIPGPGRSHMHGASKPCTTTIKPCSRAHGPQPLNPHAATEARVP